MNKKLIISFIFIFLLFMGCNTSKSNKKVDKLEQLAQISAIITVTPEKGPEILKKNGYTIESYKKAIANIMLDDKKFKEFLQKREKFLNNK